jgi:alpha-tubulin suppressor-like RCC1 family protein
MFGLPILRKNTPIRINLPKCEGATYGCDPKSPPKLKSSLRLAKMTGNHFSILVSEDWKRIITWGSTPSHGRTGVSSNSNRPQTAVINWKDKKPQSISQGDSRGDPDMQVFSTGSSNGFTIFRTESNQLYGTGNNSHYLLNKSSTGVYNSYEFITDNVKNFCVAAAIYASPGGSQAYLLYTKTNGKAYGLGVSNVGFGFASNAQKALTKDDGVASNYLGVDNVKKVFCVNPGNASKSFLLKNDGTVLACGYNTKGCLGVNSNDAIVYTWQPVKYFNGSSYVPLSGIIDVISTNTVFVGGANSSATTWAGGSYDTFMASYFLTENGEVYTCGSNKFGQLGLANNENTTRNYASKTPLSGVTMMCTAAGGTSILAATSGNELYSWGNNQWGQLGLNNQTHTNTPTKVSFPSKKIVQMHGGGMYGTINGAFLVVCDDGTLYGAGFNETYALGLSYPGTKTPDPGPIKTFRENEFFGPSPAQLTDSGRYPLILSGDLINGSDRIFNATLTASKTFTLGGTTFSNQIVYIERNFTLSGYGIQDGTIVTTIDDNNKFVFLNKPLTADASFSKIRYDQRIRVYQADLCGYGTEMAQKIVTEDGTLYMSGWNQDVGGVFNFNYYFGSQNVSVPTFFDAKFS